MNTSIQLHLDGKTVIKANRELLREMGGWLTLRIDSPKSDVTLFVSPKAEARLIEALTKKDTTNHTMTEAEKDSQEVRTQADRGIDGCSAERQNDREIPAASTHGPESEAA